MLHHSAQHNTAQHSTAPHSTAQGHWSPLLASCAGDGDEDDGEEEDEEDVCLEMERVSVKSRELRTLHERFWSLMMGRLERLQEGHDFFGSANEVDALPPQLPAI